MDGQELSATSTDEGGRGPSRKRAKSNHSNCEHKVRVRNGTYELLKNISGEEKVAMSAIIDELVQERTQRGKRPGDDGRQGGGPMDVGGFSMGVYHGLGGDHLVGNSSGGAAGDLTQQQLRAYIAQLQQQVASLEHKLEATIKCQQDMVSAMAQMQSRVESMVPVASLDAAGLSAAYGPRSSSTPTLQTAGGAGQAAGGGPSATRPGTAERPSPKPAQHSQHAAHLESWQLLLKQRGLPAGLGGGAGGLQFSRDTVSSLMQGHQRATALAAMGIDQGLVASFGAGGLGAAATLGQHLDVSHLGALTGAAGRAGSDLLSSAIGNSSQPQGGNPHALDLQMLSRASASQGPAAGMHSTENVDQ